MKKPFFLFLLFTLIISTPLFAQPEKKEAALSPVGALGKVSKGEKKILLNQMESELSKNYVLRSQEEFKRAQLRVFEELEAEECTEEACIRKIQELLQVDRLFSLQIIREGILTQITMTLSREDDKIVREDDCVNCDIIELKEHVGKLVNLVVLADLGLDAPKAAEFSQLLTDIIEREREEKSRITSKMNRVEKDYHIAINLLTINISDDYARFNAFEFSGILELGKYSGDFLYGLKYGTTSLSLEEAGYPKDSANPFVIDFTIDRTEYGVFALWFPGTNSTNLYIGLSRGALKLDGMIRNNSSPQNTFTFTADLEGTFFNLGIGNQWIMDNGTVWQFEWVLWKRLLSSSKKYSVTSNSISGFNISEFETFLENRLKYHLGGLYLVSFHLGFSF